MQPFPSINKVFSLLVQKERQHINNLKDNKVITFINKPQFSGKPHDRTTQHIAVGRGRGTKIFSYCNKIGHTNGVCLKKPNVAKFAHEDVGINETQLTTIEDIPHQDDHYYK